MKKIEFSSKLINNIGDDNLLINPEDTFIEFKPLLKVDKINEIKTSQINLFLQSNEQKRAPLSDNHDNQIKENQLIIVDDEEDPKDKKSVFGYTLVSKKPDQYNETNYIKVFCEQQQVINFLANIKKQNFTTIGLYGKENTIKKLLLQMYPNHDTSPLFLKLQDKQLQSIEQIKGFVVNDQPFLFLQEGEDSFQGQYNHHDDFILQIRFLIDCCHIIVMCLDEESIIKWEKNTPFDTYISYKHFKQIDFQQDIQVKKIEKISEDKSQISQLEKIILQDERNVIFQYRLQKSSLAKKTYENENIDTLREIENDNINKILLNSNQEISEQFKIGRQIIEDIFQKLCIPLDILTGEMTKLQTVSEQIQQKYKKLQSNEYLYKNLIDKLIHQKFIVQKYPNVSYTSLGKLFDAITKQYENLSQQPQTTENQAYQYSKKALYNIFVHPNTQSQQELQKYLLCFNFRKRFIQVVNELKIELQKVSNQYVVYQQKENQVNQFLSEQIFFIARESILDEYKQEEHKIKELIEQFKDFMDEAKKQVKKQTTDHFYELELYPQKIIFDHQSQNIKIINEIWSANVQLTLKIQSIVQYFDFDDQYSFFIGEQSKNHNQAVNCNSNKYLLFKLNKKQKKAEYQFSLSSNDYRIAINLHNSNSHKNKQNCIFVSNDSDTKIITILDQDNGGVRKYEIGENSCPETCYGSCSRQGRSHIHIRPCLGGEKCAEKIYQQARHSKYKYYPKSISDQPFDEFLCKTYWESINWQPPNKVQVENTFNKCNFGCGHISHFDPADSVKNYCVKEAWHTDNHQIEISKCSHQTLGVSFSGLLDICFTIDTTSSMSPFIQQVQEFVGVQIYNLQQSDKQYNLKVAIVGYRDHPPEGKEYVYNIFCNLVDPNMALMALNKIVTGSGGDIPEAVLDGLLASCQEIQWRDGSQRLLLHIHDAPPHGKQEYGIASRNQEWTQNGCPCKIRVSDIAKELKKYQIMYYLIKCGKKINLLSMEESVFKKHFEENLRKSINVENPQDLNLNISDIIIKEIKYNQEIVLNFTHQNQNRESFRNSYKRFNNN